MKKRKIALLCLCMAGVLFCNSMSAFATENTESEVRVITGFEELEDNCIVLDERGTQEELIEQMPESLVVELDGEEEEEISVTWESEDDYDETNYDYYEFFPCWDDEKYVLSEDLDSYWDVPCMQVVAPAKMSEEELAYIEEAKEELKELLEEETVLALVYLCDKYGLKEEADGDSDTLIELTTGTTVEIRGVVIDKARNIWYQVACPFEEETYIGYVERSNLAYSNESFLEWEAEYMSSYMAMMISTFSRSYPDVDTFPESYQDALTELKEKHPKWIFVRQDVNLDWEDVIEGESYGARNVISNRKPDAYLDGDWGQGYSYASDEAIAYYMDPRNFLDDTKVFQFEQLTFNHSYHTTGAVQLMLKGTFMQGELPNEDMSYAEAFYEVGADLKVSPFHLASRVYQEQNPGTSPLISGTYKGYEGYYNYFNIGASGDDDKEVIVAGLSYAKGAGWNTRYKSIKGGAKVIASYYILKGQDTLYLQKFNVDGRYNSYFTHQYMQNIVAPASESYKIKQAYVNSGTVENSFVFKIPVYREMPEEACPVPGTVVKATPTPTATPIPTATATPTPTPTATPSPTPTATPTPTASPTPKATETPTPTPKATATASPTPKTTETPTPTPKATPTTSPTPKATATPTPTPKATATASPTPKATETPTPTPKATATASPTPKATETPTPTPKATATASPTPKATATATPTPTPTPTPTATPTPTPKATATASPTPKATETPTPTPKATATASPTPKATATVSPTPKATETPTPTPKATETPTPTPKATATASPTPKATETPTPTPKATATASPTPKATEAPTPEATETPTENQLIPVLPQPTNKPDSALNKQQETTTVSEETATESPTATPESSNNTQNSETQTTQSTEPAKEQKTVVMTMEENTKVYAETLEKIKEEGTEMVLAMNEEVTWTINGSEITSDSLTDIDFAVTVGSSEIPEEKLTELVEGEEKYVEMSLAHEGEFGFDAVLTISLENATPGEYANLFYYNESTEEFEFLCAAPIGEDNNAAFNFKHASDYVIVISEQTMDDKVEIIQEAREQTKLLQEAEHKAELAAKDAPAEEPVKATGIIILILLGSIAIAIGGILIINRKK